MNYKIDIKRIIDGNIELQGWVLPEKDLHANVEYKVYDSKRNEIIPKIIKTKRQDVENIYIGEDRENVQLGFVITFPYKEKEVYTFYITADGKTVKEILHKDIIDKFNSYKYRKLENFISCLNAISIKRALQFLKKEGFTAFIKKTNRKVKGIDAEYQYNEWYKLTKVSEDELDRQRNEYKKEFSYLPLFSIVIPVYDTPDKFLRLLFDSIINQTYQEYEVCVADATDYNNAKNNPKRFFENLLKNDKLSSKIHIKYLSENKSISDNTNAAIDMAKGDYIILCDHDDEITTDALYEIAKAINNNKEYKFIYSDEDKVDLKDQNYSEPNFKPDFNLDMILSVNYICHLTTIEKGVLYNIKEDKNYLRPEYNGAQDYDLFLRIINYLYKEEKGEKNIYHIKKVLYHWRCHDESTSKNIESKKYAFENGKKAIMDFYEKTTLDFKNVEKVEDGADVGIYHTVYKKIEKEPLVTVIIPNKDHIEDLDKAIKSIKKGDYRNIEYIIVENNSTEKETFEYYDKIKKDKDNDIKIIKYEGEFNFSKINNFGVKHANSEYILFLNNDVEMIEKNSINELVNYIERKDVGMVGAKLLYPDDTIQHAGVVIGFGGIAGHTFIGKHDKDHTYGNRAQIVQDYSAVTAACMMIKKSLFEKIGGFDEKLAVAFNDIDLCMKVRKEDKLIVYNPYCAFYHFESKSRGLEDTKEKIDRFNKETAYFNVKWKNEMKDIDRYYNPNLTLRKSDFSLRNLRYEKIGEIYDLPKKIKELMKEYE